MLVESKPRRRWPAADDELICDARETSWGWMGAVASPRGLCRLTLPRDVPDHAYREIADGYGPIPSDAGAFSDLFAQLERYFAGERVGFDLALDLAGTAFQRDVWQCLRRIPYGAAWSYQDVAREVGRPLGARPVGQAVGRNPIGIIVPCHRVIAAGGKIGGFGDQIDLKRRLLALEGVNVR
jgi:O-6-methylguanine DNA methyltransferase